MTIFLRRLALVATVVASVWVSAAPVDAFLLGRQLKSFEEERQLAVSQHTAIVEQFGGEYDDPDLSAYVDRIGQRIVANSDMAGLPFRFTVLDNPIVNAFTTGGGHVYVTRGIIAAINTEAELAALLAHEVAHVTERHSAQREARIEQDRAMTLGVGLLSGSLRAALLSDILGNVSRSDYSRSQERDADRIGVRDSTKAGYDPYGMSDMLQVLERQDALATKMSGGQSGISLPD